MDIAFNRWEWKFSPTQWLKEWTEYTIYLLIAWWNLARDLEQPDVQEHRRGMVDGESSQTGTVMGDDIYQVTCDGVD